MWGSQKRLVSNPPVSEVVQVSVSAVYQLKPTLMKRPSSTKITCHACLFRLEKACFPIHIYINTQLNFSTDLVSGPVLLPTLDYTC